MPCLITPSIYCCEQTRMHEDLVNLVKAGIKWIHFDVMDGAFVHNYGLNPKLLEEVKTQFPSLIVDVHLMANEICENISLFKKADYLTFHNSAKNKMTPDYLISKIKENGIKPGMAIDLDENLACLEKYLPHIELVTIMSIKPGFTGQRFEEQTWNTIEKIVAYKKLFPHLKFQIDGGVRAENIKKLAMSGFDLIVVGSLLFNFDNYSEGMAAIGCVKNVGENV